MDSREKGGSSRTQMNMRCDTPIPTEALATEALVAEALAALAAAAAAGDSHALCAC